MEGAHQSHKPGLFKQPNKKFKTGRHRTKGEINRDQKGRKNVIKKQIGPGAKLAKRVSRADRINLRKQVRLMKIAATEEQRRLEGGSNRAPHLVTILSLDPELLAVEVLERLLKADEEATVTHSERAGLTYLNVPRFKSRFGFLCPPLDNLDVLLDCLKVSDVLLLLWPTDGELSEEQRVLLDLILAHGLPTPMHVVAGLPQQGKQREQLRKTVLKTIDKWVSTKGGLFFLDSNSDQLQVLRHLPTMRKKPLLNQRRRPHIFAEKLEMVDVQNGTGTLKLTGYGWGDFQLQKDHETARSAPVARGQASDGIRRAGDRRRRSRPPGAEDEDDEDDEEDDDEMEVDGGGDAGGKKSGRRVQFDMRPKEEEDDEEADEAMSVVSTANDAMSIAGMDDVIDEAEVQRFREEVENQQWPDQVDVAVDQLARERTSPWDPKENLPADYARIFKFGNFKRTKQLVLEDWLFPGSYVTIYIKNVPDHYPSQYDQNTPLIVSGLLKHEQKFSVMNVVLRKYPHCKLPIKNKQPLVFHVGFRRYEVNPVFSQHANGDKFKMERFMPEGTPFVASYYAPVTFGPCPVLVFQRDADGNKQFVAYGSVSDANPDRVVLKRVVLCGNPFKMVKRSAVVRFMFFNKEDIEWFKPVELYTDGGNRGHIKDSVGTHGLMKCVFNLPLKKQEQVKMNLYKRAFPRWSYVPHV
ncbi:Pre-rRNA-processing protein TSR1-like protein [Aphelenchoides fujianensis]|nr:Pre-rRNA-processing protein TSR1-like protein [Aphelenchoides fujianensis]